MVHVLLIILKVLGITLLILLGVVLLVVLLALLAPFRYTLQAEYYGDVKAVGRIRWLCFVLDLKGTYGNNQFLYYLKSFGFTISTNDENSPHYHKGMEPEDIGDNADAKEDAELAATPIKVRALDEWPEEDTIPVLDEGKEKPEWREEARYAEQAEKPEALPPPRRSLLQRIDDKFRQGMEWFTTIPMKLHEKFSKLLGRILDFFANITENINRILNKRNEIVQKITHIRGFLQKESTGRAFKDVKRYLLRLWKSIRPRKLHGILHFGLEDPASTGQLLGVFGLLLPIYRDRIIIAPDFEQKIFEGEVYAKGSVQLGFFILLALQMLLNRNLMNTIQEIRTIIGGNN